MTQGNWPQPPGHPGWNRPGSLQSGWQQPQQPQRAFQQSQWGPPPNQQQWRPPYPGPQQQWQGGYRPPPPPRRSGGFGKTIFVLVGVAIVLVLAVNVFRAVADVLQPLVPGISPSASASESREPEPVVEPAEPGETNPGLPPRTWEELPAPDSTDPDWMTLQQSAIYAQPVPLLEGCPEPELAYDMGDLERIATGQMECIQAAFKPIQAALGYSTDDIPIYFYEGRSVDTPCGQVSAPALYCSTQGGAIYFGEDSLNGASWMDFGVKDVTGHEYGHHLQAQSGMFQAEYAVGQGGNESARRIELQATCWGYAMMAHDPTQSVGEASLVEFEQYLRATIEDGIHGSKDSMAYWGIRGLYSADMGNCNTWTVAPEDVD